LYIQSTHILTGKKVRGEGREKGKRKERAFFHSFPSEGGGEKGGEGGGERRAKLNGSFRLSSFFFWGKGGEGREGGKRKEDGM